jgi:hypothetical protein
MHDDALPPMCNLSLPTDRLQEVAEESKTVPAALANGSHE